MHIITFKRFKIRTDLSREEIHRRIVMSHEYEGTSTFDGFSIQRVISYRNSFRPQIEGRISNDGGNALSIDIKMGIHKSIFIFFLLFIPIFAVFNFGNSNDSQVPIPLFTDTDHRFIFVGMFLLIFITAIILFRMESRRSTKDLLRILDAVPAT